MSIFQNQLVELIPVIRAYALFLTGKPSDADDLVQQSLEKAWRGQDGYVAGTNLKAWVLTIVRNSHHNNWRQRDALLKTRTNGRLAACVLRKASTGAPKFAMWRPLSVSWTPTRGMRF